MPPTADQRTFLAAVLAKLVKGRTQADRQKLAAFIRDVGLVEESLPLEEMLTQYQARFEDADEKIVSGAALLLTGEQRDMPAVRELGVRKLRELASG